MSQHMSYSIGFLLIIAMGFYFMYGNPFSAHKVDMGMYQSVCDQYLQAQKGANKSSDVQMLVNEINYIVPNEVSEITDEPAKKLKACGQKLDARLKAGEI